MNRSRIFIILVIIAASFSVLVTTLAFFLPDSLKEGPWKDWIIPASGILTGVMAVIFFSFIQANGTHGYRPYNIAIIGSPGSGKTSLLVTLFQQVFDRKISNIKATLRGESTIARMNEDMMRRDKGLAPNPTTDQTMFAYRVDIEARAGLFHKIFRVEFGDYPGEYSEWLTETNHFSQLKQSEYFQWCVQADAYIFIVDTARYLLAKNKADFVAESTKSMRESWQLFLDSKYATANQLARKPVLLVFTKMDLCNLIDIGHSKKNGGVILERLIMEKAFSQDNNKPIDIRSDKYKFLREELVSRYANLFSYFNSECKYFSVLYSSSYGKINDHYADVQKILKQVLPAQLRP